MHMKHMLMLLAAGGLLLAVCCWPLAAGCCSRPFRVDASSCALACLHCNPALPLPAWTPAAESEDNTPTLDWSLVWIGTPDKGEAHHDEVLKKANDLLARREVETEHTSRSYFRQVGAYSYCSTSLLSSRLWARAQLGVYLFRVLFVPCLVCSVSCSVFVCLFVRVCACLDC
jgi:hypothetical protein